MDDKPEAVEVETHIENMTDEPVRYLILGPPLDNDEEEELESEMADY